MQVSIDRKFVSANVDNWSACLMIATLNGETGPTLFAFRDGREHEIVQSDDFGFLCRLLRRWERSEMRDKRALFVPMDRVVCANALEVR